MQHQFSRVPAINIPRSSFDRSHTHKTTFDAGILIPILVDEALPGDTFNLKMTAFARLATPIVPIMDNMYMDTHFFAVPYRLVWENWEKFNGAQDDPGDSTDFTIPRVGLHTVLEGDILDHMGIPPGGQAADTINALPLRAYNLIWNEWFRDQNLQDSVSVSIANGPTGYTNFGLQRRGKRHDYFTSCLPNPQKGPSVSLPLGTSADVHTAAAVTEPVGVFSDAEADFRNLDSDGLFVDVSATGGAGPDTNRLYADLNNATSATINQLREAVTIQQLFEMDARGGTRYTEIIKVHFGVTSPDARLQRPEYLGGGSSPVNVSPISQTSSTDATTPQGNLAAIGTATLHNHGFTKSFTEHCIIIGLVSVRADLTYQQGIQRQWSRETRFDYYLPTFANIGEQAVLNKEIFHSNVPAIDDAVFGFQERYAEYRYAPSLITGEFRSSAATSLDFWHLSQDFSVLPVLDATFIEETPPVARVIAVPGEPQFLFDSHFNIRAARPMPIYSTPGLNRF